MSGNRLTLSSPLSEIAKDIGEKYLLRPFPTGTLFNGLLDYDSIRRDKIDKNELHRPIHGYQNACRVAALIPVLFELYKRHINELPEYLQREIASVTPDEIKKYQIVGLMRTTGRTQDSDSGYKFSKQGKKECFVYLKNLGVSDAEESKILASSIVESEQGEKEPSLITCLLADATTIETFRDTLPRNQKRVQLHAFSFCRALSLPIKSETIGEFIDLCCQHVEVIRKHQGFLLSGIQDEHGNPIVDYWPTLDDYPYWRNNIDKLRDKQKQIEYDKNCFQQCEKDVAQSLKILSSPSKLDAPPSKLADLFQEFFSNLNKLKIEPTDNIKFIENLFLYFEDKIGNPVIHSSESGDFSFILSWDAIKYYMVKEKNILTEENFTPVSISQHACVTKSDNNWFLINFGSKDLVEHYLRLIRLYLPSSFYRELQKAQIMEESNNVTTYYRFKLTQLQFDTLASYFPNVTKENLVITNNISTLIMELSLAIKDGDTTKVCKLLDENPALINFHNDKGYLPIHMAIRNNNFKLVKLFIEKYKADINSQLRNQNLLFDGMTPVYFASGLKSCSNEILEYLIKQGADINIPCKNGRTALAIAALSDLESKVKILISSGNADPNIVMDNGHTALINAVENGSARTLQQILSIPGINVNHKRSDGESALFIAVKKGDAEKVKLLLEIPGIDITAMRDHDRKTVLQMAQDNRNHEILKLFEEKIKEENLKQIAELETETEEIRKIYPFENYALTLRKVPDETLYLNYLKEVKLLAGNQRITTTEAAYVKARKLWGDVVSDTYRINQEYSAKNDIKAKVIKRISAIGVENPEQLYEDCIAYIRQQSVITLTFRPEFLSSGLTDFQPLNMWEKDNRNSSGYTSKRDNTEHGVFQSLPENLRDAFFSDKQARPRYGTLLLLDPNTQIKPTSNYGSSFIVFKEVVKFNSIFCPGDSLDYKNNMPGKDYIPCTINNLEFLLWQCPDNTLEAIVERVENGKFPITYNQNSWNTNGGYLEVMLPAVNIFDPNLVEHIHINARQFKVSQEDMAFIQDLGITITNSSQETPYHELSIQLRKAIKNDDVDIVSDLLKKYPSLLNITDKDGLFPIHIASARGSMKVLRLFAEWGCDFTITSLDHDSVLTMAVLNNKLDTLKFVIDEIHKQSKKTHEEIINESDTDGLTALHQASKGHADIVEYLLHKGANINAVTNKGSTPLHLSVFHQQKKITGILVSNNADFKIENNKGQTAFDLRNDKNKKFRNTLNEMKNELLDAIAKGNIETITQFVDKNRRWLSLPLDNRRYTALHIAVAVNNLASVKLLVETYKMNINQQVFNDSAIENGATPVYLASDLSVSEDILRYLISQDADVNYINKDGDSALSIAVKNRDLDKIKLLLSGINNNAHRQSAASALILKHCLTMADKNGDRDIAYMIAKVYLPFYVYKTEQRPSGDHRIKISIFGKHLTYSSDEKLAAARALNKEISNDTAFDKKELSKFKGELTDGELGLISKSLKIKF